MSSKKTTKLEAICILAGTIGIFTLVGVQQYTRVQEKKEAVMTAHTYEPKSMSYLGFDDNKDGEIDRVKRYMVCVMGRGAAWAEEEATPENPRFEVLLKRMYEINNED